MKFGQQLETLDLSSHIQSFRSKILDKKHRQKGQGNRVKGDRENDKEMGTFSSLQGLK